MFDPEFDETMDTLLLWPKLDPRSRYLLEGTYILEKSAEEIAEDLGIKTSSIRMSLTRAKRKARMLISGEMAL